MSYGCFRYISVGEVDKGIISSALFAADVIYVSLEDYAKVPRKPAVIDALYQSLEDWPSSIFLEPIIVVMDDYIYDLIEDEMSIVPAPYASSVIYEEITSEFSTLSPDWYIAVFKGDYVYDAVEDEMSIIPKPFASSDLYGEITSGFETILPDVYISSFISDPEWTMTSTFIPYVKKPFGEEISLAESFSAVLLVGPYIRETFKVVPSTSDTVGALVTPDATTDYTEVTDQDSWENASTPAIFYARDFVGDAGEVILDVDGLTAGAGYIGNFAGVNTPDASFVTQGLSILTLPIQNQRHKPMKLSFWINSCDDAFDPKLLIVFDRSPNELGSEKFIALELPTSTPPDKTYEKYKWKEVVFTDISIPAQYSAYNTLYLKFYPLNASKFLIDYIVLNDVDDVQIFN
jgi:hypothetical protein